MSKAVENISVFELIEVNFGPKMGVLNKKIAFVSIVLAIQIVTIR